MKVVVKQLDSNQSVIEVDTHTGLQVITISKTPNGYSYDDFDEWDISERQYEDLDDLVSNIIDRMRGNSSLDVSYEI